METKEEKLTRLKKMREELDKLTTDEFLQIVKNKYGDDTATFVVGAKFDEYAREILGKRLDGQIAELEK